MTIERSGRDTGKGYKQPGNLDYNLRQNERLAKKAAATAAASVIDSIADGDTTHAPSRNAVFDALASKQPLDTQLTDLAALAYVGNALKNIRVNAAENGFEVAAGGSGIVRVVSVISTPTTAGAAATTDYVYLVSGTTTLTLPTAVGNTNEYTVKNVGVNTVSIASTAAQTFDGSASPITITVANVSLTFISDGANWDIK